MSTTPRRILVIKWRAMGDTVLMTAALEALRLAYPRAEIDVCVSSAWAPLLAGHPAIRRVIPFERRSNRRARLRSLMKLGFELRTNHYDTVLNLHASPSSSTIALATGALTRAVHFHGHTARNRYSTLVIPDKGVLKPIIERDLDVIRALGVSVPIGRHPPKIYLTQEEQVRAKVRLEAAGFSAPILALALGASRETKRWAPERWADIASRWNRERGGAVLALGSPNETHLLNEWKSATLARGITAEQIATWTDLSVRELAATLSQVAVLAGNDSGPRHLAVAVGRPTLTLFGPEDPFEWHPYSRDQHPALFVPHLECRKDAEPGYPPWCGLNSCGVERHRCMTEISVNQVWEHLKNMGARA